MQIDKLSPDRLFVQQSRETVKEWLARLKYFRLKRGWGGHANDGDDFQVAFQFTDKQNLIDRLAQIGVSLNHIPADSPKPVAGQSYSASEYEKFKDEIEQFRDLEQPGSSIVFGHQVYIRVYDHYFRLTVSGSNGKNPYQVTQDDFMVCLDLEKNFDRLGWQDKVDSVTEDNVCCITPARYPELFE